MVSHAEQLLEAIKQGVRNGSNTKPLEHSLLTLLGSEQKRPMCCLHLGKALDMTVKVDCKTCDGKQVVENRVYECEVHRRCLAHYQPVDIDKWITRKPESDIYQLCFNCPDKKLAT